VNRRIWLSDADDLRVSTSTAVILIAMHTLRRWLLDPAHAADNLAEKTCF
jgi:hypothetical protein